MRDIRIDTERGTIYFSGRTYSEWGHIRWLRLQLAIIETNAEALWGSENKVARKAIEDEKLILTVIDGGKEEP